MKSVKITCIIFILCLIGCTTSDQSSSRHHTPPSEWEEPRNWYTSFDEAYRDRIKVGQVKRSEVSTMESEKHPSPNDAYWYRIEEPELSEKGIWNASVLVHNEREDLIEISFRDHRSTGPVAKWINGKLLYLEIWWGRALGTSMIFDMEAKKFIHREMVHWGRNAYRQWQQAERQGLLEENDSDQ